MKRVLITSVQVPFARGGAEILVDCLAKELKARGFLVDVLQMPFGPQKEFVPLGAAMWCALTPETVGAQYDLVIGTKFPSYCIRCKPKVVWLVHQHRQMYELHGTRFSDFNSDSASESIRQSLMDLDQQAFSECENIFSISQNVADRLKRYLGFEAEVLLPPLPLGIRYRSEPAESYVLSVGRLCSIKRVDVMLKAMPMVHADVKLKIVGLPDEPEFQQYLHNEIDKHHLWDRVEFLGRVSDEELIDLYARAHCVFYAPFDEDYGYVTLESLASGKPVVTGTDSGGVLSFVQHEVNGLVVTPTEPGIAGAVNRLREDNALYSRLCENARSMKLPMDWDHVISRLTAPLSGTDGEQRLS